MSRKEALEKLLGEVLPLRYWKRDGKGGVTPCNMLEWGEERVKNGKVKQDEVRGRSRVHGVPGHGPWLGQRA